MLMVEAVVTHEEVTTPLIPPSDRKVAAGEQQS
jgi:hypothetical protein